MNATSEEVPSTKNKKAVRVNLILSDGFDLLEKVIGRKLANFDRIVFLKK